MNNVGIWVASLISVMLASGPSAAQSIQLAASSAQPSAAAPPLAPAAPEARTGDWLGGPEPPSGKRPTGIALYYRAVRPHAGQPFELVLRFEGATRDDAQVRLQTSDGARLLLPVGATTVWRLRTNGPSQLKVTAMAPPGDSYVHVLTSQGGRQTSRSIALRAPSHKPLPAAGYRGSDAHDARGEPIVRMQAE
ncbi:MAG: hypothetical protein AUJ20_02665 [Comamonadaceae bacterium CG1_02_60_18]|nr:MAG: hypothetical protein AUJ20_02665 [Comamonadaceae bacterium CG1_02_60_18]PIQ52981.1 MAG: hypothetical protein COW02_07765 [Comamonadaceae bacterium CG12_big_fil_rev_8_21_14_0_65_59_15]